MTSPIQLHNIEIFSDGEIGGVIAPLPPRIEKLCVVLHGFQLAQPNHFLNDVEFYFPNTLVQARPCAIRMKDFRPTVMTKQLQEMHFRVLQETAGDIMTESELKDAFRSLWANGREYNDHGAADGTNFISNPNGDGPGFKMNPIEGDGAILEIIGSATTLGVIKGKNFGLGEACWPVRFMNAMNMDYTSTPQKHPWGWHRANIARRDGRIIRYGQLKDRDVWMPNLRPDSNVNWIPCSRVRVLSQTEPLPNPYVPAV